MDEKIAETQRNGSPETKAKSASPHFFGSVTGLFSVWRLFDHLPQADNDTFPPNGHTSPQIGPNRIFS
jgi:hypothetical protein